MPSNSPDGLITNPAGPEVAHVNLTPRQAKEKGLLTSGTYGPRSFTLSKLENLSQSLANKLKQRLTTAGLISLKMTCKELTTPSGISLSASYFGARHLRKRIYFVANNKRQGRPRLVASQDTRQLGQKRWPSQKDLQSFAQSPFTKSNLWPQPLFAAMWMGYPPEWNDSITKSAQSFHSGGYPIHIAANEGLRPQIGFVKGLWAKDCKSFWLGHRFCPSWQVSWLATNLGLPWRLLLATK